MSDDPPDGKENSYRKCRKFIGIPAVIQDVTCAGGYTDRIGRHVIIQVPGRSKILSLCEVQVFGFIPGKDLQALCALSPFNGEASDTLLLMHLTMLRNVISFVSSGNQTIRNNFVL